MSTRAELHAGHRARLKKLAAEKGLWGLPDHVILELLLFYALPRVDTNDIAHRLIRRFGSLQRVFDADPQELIQVPGSAKMPPCS